MNPLQKKLMEASQKYYSDGSSTLSDEEFDSLAAQLKEQEPDNPILHKVGFGYDVNKDTTPGEKVKHKYGKAGSLTKAYNWKELNQSFIQDEVHASLKLDGLSVVLYYYKGELYQALTRGDGTVGIDITPKIQSIMGTQLKDKAFTGAVRGEILMTVPNFRIFKQLHPEAKNPRNSAAGLINSKDLSPDLQYLDVVVYTVVGDESSAEDTKHRRTVQSWLESQFEHVVPYSYVWLTESNYLDGLNALKSCWEGIYPSDGIVLSDPIIQRNTATGEMTYNSQAFKFASETATTKVTEVEWNLSKSRYLIPRVLVEPVELAGTMVSAATGFNAKYILDNNLGKGSQVEVEKHGEIIPNINKVLVPSKTELPTVCPICGTELIWSGVHLSCPNTECSNAATQDMLIWLEQLVPTDRLGDTLKLKFAKQLTGQNSVSVEDIMNLAESAATYTGTYADQIVSATIGAGVQLDLFLNMLCDLYTKRFTLSAAIKALNIPRFGEITADKLAAHGEQVKSLIYVQSEDEAYSLLSKLEGIGRADATAWSKNLNKVARLQLIADRIDWSTNDTEIRGRVAITGKLSVKRSDFQSELKLAGFIVTDVNKDTDFLITDDPDSNSSKNQKADKFGITKITEGDFRSKYL